MVEGCEGLVDRRAPAARRGVRLVQRGAREPHRGRRGRLRARRTASGGTGRRRPRPCRVPAPGRGRGSERDGRTVAPLAGSSRAPRRGRRAGTRRGAGRSGPTRPRRSPRPRQRRCEGADAMTRRGPRDIAKAAIVIIEGMKGEPLDEEIEDVMTVAIWDAVAGGKESVPAQRMKRTKARPVPEGAPETNPNSKDGE